MVVGLGSFRWRLGERFARIGGGGGDGNRRWGPLYISIVGLGRNGMGAGIGVEMYRSEVWEVPQKYSDDIEERVSWRNVWRRVVVVVWRAKLWRCLRAVHQRPRPVWEWMVVRAKKRRAVKRPWTAKKEAGAKYALDQAAHGKRPGAQKGGKGNRAPEMGLEGRGETGRAITSGNREDGSGFIRGTDGNRKKGTSQKKGAGEKDRGRRKRRPARKKGRVRKQRRDRT